MHDLKDGIPCYHIGCLNHISHPCEGCGRVNGIRFDHELKVWTKFFTPLKDEIKTFEIRNNDRNFKVGDRLWLRDFSPETGEYSGDYIFREVTYMTAFGQPEGQVVLAVKKFI